MNLDVEESTYSTLCNPLLDSLKSSEAGNGEQFQNDLSEYRNLVRSLELQHEASVSDLKTTMAQIATVEAELAAAQDEYDQLGRIADALKSDVDAQKTITNLAKAKFVAPVELEVDGRRVSTALNKTIAQLDEDHQFLEDQLTELEDELAKEAAELDRRITASAELQDVVTEMRDKLLSGKGDISNESKGQQDDDLFGHGHSANNTPGLDLNSTPDVQLNGDSHSEDAGQSQSANGNRE